jgi:hypothetical protein
MQVRQHILSNATYQLHAGNSSIWSSPGPQYGVISMIICLR